MALNYEFMGETLLINKFYRLFEIPKDEIDIFSVNYSDELTKHIEYAIKTIDEVEIHERITKLLYSELAYFDYEKCQYFYIPLYSPQEQKVVIDIGFAGFFKLWLNRKLLYAGNKFQQNIFMQVTLRQGNNEIMIEYINQPHNTLAHGYLHIHDYAKAMAGLIYPNLKEILESKERNIISSYFEGYLSYMIISHDQEEYSVKYNYRDDQQEQVIKALWRYKVFVGEFENQLKDITITLDNGSIYTLHIFIPQGIVTELLEKAAMVSREDENYVTVNGIVNKLTIKHLSDMKRFELLALLKELLINKKVSTKRKYYTSKIDNKIMEIIIREPRDYVSEKKYPLIMYFVDKEEEFISDEFTDCKDFFFVDFYCGGITGGGYISEGRYLEAINYLLTYYSIDEDKIFLVGQSHSSFDLWSIMICYPHLMAAAYVISGYPRIGLLNNVSNIPIKNVVSNLDYNYLNNTHIIKENIDSRNYSQLDLKDIIHDSLSNFKLYNIPEFFYGKKRTLFPEHVFFKSEMNMYTKSFWIKTGGIDYGKRDMEVDAKLLSDTFIAVHVKNISDISITLPDSINRKYFILNLNNQKFEFSDYSSKEVQFRKTASGFELAKDLPRVNVRKGLGLLHIYSAPLKIYIPDQYTQAEKNVAINFASPKTYGIVNRFDVSFPIDYLSNHTSFEEKDNVLFINKSSFSDDPDIHNLLKIISNSDYFEYKEKKYYGDYCIMQIIRSPINNNRSVLLINANNDAFLKNNLLLRNVMLPFMFNGFHSYYHNEAVIFWDKKYFGVYEFCNDMIEII